MRARGAKSEFRLDFPHASQWAKLQHATMRVRKVVMRVTDIDTLSNSMDDHSRIKRWLQWTREWTDALMPVAKFGLVVWHELKTSYAA